MATVNKLKAQIENANAIGIANLKEKGVEFMSSDGCAPTTYEIMQAISLIDTEGSGGGASYTSIVYNEDDTITLIDTDGTEHTMTCTYEDGKLISVAYDGKAIELVYEGEELKSVGRTAVDLSGYFKESETVVLDFSANFAYNEDASGYTATASSEENPFESYTFYTLNIGDKAYRMVYISYDAGSEGVICYLVGEDDSKFIIQIIDGMLYMSSFLELEGEQNITISTRSTEPNYLFGVHYYESRNALDFILRTNDFEASEGTVVITDESGTELYNSTEAFIDDGNNLPYKSAHFGTISDEGGVLNTEIINGKAITVKVSQTIDGNTVEKTYGGVPYEFIWTEPDEAQTQLYAWGSDFKLMAEMQGS